MVDSLPGGFDDTGPQKSEAEIEAEIARLGEQLARVKVENAKKRYPIKDKFYSHSGKEDGMEDAEKLGFKQGTDAYETYCRTGYEIAFDVLVNEDGTVMATHVNGVELVEPVEI